MRVCRIAFGVLGPVIKEARILFVLATAAHLWGAQVNSTVIMLATPNPVVQSAGVTIVAGVNGTSESYATGTISITDSCPGVATPIISTLGTIALGSATSTTPGAGSLSVTTFPCLGQNTLTAQYLGDANYAPGTSAPLIETVLDQFAPATVTLTSSANPAALGQSISFTAQITYAIAQNSHATGTVNFIDTTTGSILGTGTVQTSGSPRQGTSTIAAFTTSSLATGSYAVQASYSGDNIYASATSQVVNQVVQGDATQATTTTLSASANQVTQGVPVTFTALVATPNSVPTGTLTFLDNGTLLGTVALDSNGQAFLTTSSLSAGNHPITATYGGSGQLASSTSSTVTVVVQATALTQTATLLASSENPALTGDAISLSASISGSDGGSPTGTVSFLDGGVTLGSAPLQNGVASLSVVLPAGTHPLTATYNGDASYASSQGMLSQLVNAPSLAPTAMAISSSANPSTYGQAVTFTTVVTGSTAAPRTGTVTFSVGSATATMTLDSTGMAVFTTSSVAVGTANVSATYSGDGANAGSTSPVLGQTVTRHRLK